MLKMSRKWVLLTGIKLMIILCDTIKTKHDVFGDQLRTIVTLIKVWLLNCIYEKRTNDIGNLMVNKHVIGASVIVSWSLEGKQITTLISSNAYQHFDKGFFELFYCFYNFHSVCSKSTLHNKGNMPSISHSNFWINFFEFLNHCGFFIDIITLDLTRLLQVVS